MENKYPYIGKSEVTGDVALLTSQCCGYFIECKDANRIGSFSKKLHETYFTNITADYLRNTKIRIESPEHSELVQKLVFGAGGKWGCGDLITLKSHEYIFINAKLIIRHTSNEGAFTESQYKEIKLPMPPSQLPEVSSETPMPKAKPLKEGGLNLNPNCVLNPIHGGLRSCKTDEWPKVGDEIVTTDCKANKADLIKPNVKGVVLTEEFKGEFCVKLPRGLEVMDRSQFKKPITPQEKLARLIYEFGGTDTHYCENLSKTILAGEIEGLVYKGD